MIKLVFSVAVLMGDLNYRIRLPGKWAAPYHVALARRLIASGGFGALYEHDEVCRYDSALLLIDSRSIYLSTHLISGIHKCTPGEAYLIKLHTFVSFYNLFCFEIILIVCNSFP